MAAPSDADRQRPITMDADTNVITVGHLLRYLKLDELPTLLNVLKGDMTIVGPRPEIPPYVELYTPMQRQVLSVRPGFTNPSTLRFNDEAESLVNAAHFEQVCVEQILPEKLRLNLEYISKRSFFYDLRIILATLLLILLLGKR